MYLVIKIEQTNLRRRRISLRLVCIMKLFVLCIGCRLPHNFGRLRFGVGIEEDKQAQASKTRERGLRFIYDTPTYIILHLLYFPAKIFSSRQILILL